MQTIVPKIGYAFKKKSFFGKLFIDFEKKKNLVKLSFSDPKLPLRTLIYKIIYIQAKQKVPPFIATLESEEEKFLNHGSKDDAGCSYCGGNYFYF